MTTIEKLEELIYHGFKETDRKFQETDRRFKETDLKFQETDRQFKETDRQFKETDRKFQDTDREIKQTGDLIRETHRDLKDLGWRFEKFTDSVGWFAESMVKPATKRIFEARGITLISTHSRSSSRLDGNGIEVDILGVGPEHVVAVEVKLKLGVRDVDDHLERLRKFFDFFPYYRGLTLYGAVAGMTIDEGVDRYAYHNGLFVLSQSGENIHLLNDEKFIPRPYRYSSGISAKDTL